MAPDLPYWRLSGFYFFYFAAVGTLVPFAPVYLESLGFGAADIGVAMSMLVVSRIFGPNVWSWMCDRWKKPARIVQATAILAIPAFYWVVSTRSPTIIPLALLVFGFFWSASLPQMESATLNSLGTRTELYSRIRVWGSIGFIAAAAAIGRVIQVNGVSVFPGAMLALLACLALVILLQRESVFAPAATAREPLTDVLKDRRVVALFAACLLMHVGHGPYYTFFSIYLGDIGYRAAAVGDLWSLGVIAEVIVFLALDRLSAAFGVRALILTSLALAALRWAMTGFLANYLGALIIAQCLHAATFGIFHVAVIQVIHRRFQGSYQARGQALYSSLTYGVGGAVGTLLSGYSWQALGAHATFALAAIMSLMAFWIARRWALTLS